MKRVKCKYFEVPYEKEVADASRLVELLKADPWITKDLILVNCEPDYSSITVQLVNHKLSSINSNELLEQISLEMPYPIMSQVWNRETREYELFDRYLTSWTNKYISTSYKYLFLTSAITTGKNFHHVKNHIKTRLDPENYRFGTVYISNVSTFTPDFKVEDINGPILFQWENNKNPNFDY